MSKFSWLEIIEIAIKLTGVVLFIPATYFILITMIEIQNVMISTIV